MILWGLALFRGANCESQASASDSPSMIRVFVVTTFLTIGAVHLFPLHRQSQRGLGCIHNRGNCRTAHSHFLAPLPPTQSRWRSSTRS
jgi:hypothetical protein